MKKILTLALISTLILPAISLAYEVAPDLPIMYTLDRIIDWLFTILLVVAAMFIVISAYFFVTAQGDPDQVKKARNFVLYTLVGVLVAFGARGLVQLMRQVVGE